MKEPDASQRPAFLFANRSRMEKGIIRPPRGMEVIVNDHCNISCRQCNHASPVMPKYNADPGTLQRDLTLLARVYGPHYAKIIGGEPLLHPDLAAFMEAVRASGLTDRLILVTNGTLRRRMTPGIWRGLTEVELSVYPGVGLDAAEIARWEADAKANHRKIRVCHFPEFRFTFTSQPNPDPALVRDVFDACKMAHVWGCHAYYGGRIHRCPQSIYAPAIAGAPMEDGFALDGGEDLASRLLAYLNSESPLKSCTHCVGSCGKRIDHALIPREGWRADCDRPVEDILDRALMERSLRERIDPDDCKIIERRKRGLLGRIAASLR
ncbi:MAG: radical SAM protein [Rubricella sp.]